MLSKLQEMQAQVKSGTTTWNEYFDVFKEKNQGYLVDFVQNTDLQKASTDDLIKANQSARQSALDHNAALKQQTLGAKAAAAATGLLKTALNAIAYYAIAQAITSIISRFDELVNAYQNGIDKLKDLSSEIKGLESKQSSLNSELKESQERLHELQQIKMPNLFEQAEIENIKEYNKQLELQIRLLELELELKRQEANKTAQDNFKNSQIDYNPYDDLFEKGHQWWEYGLFGLGNLLTNGGLAVFKNSLENLTSWFQGNPWEQQMDYLEKAENSLANYKGAQQALENYQIIMNNFDKYQEHIANFKTVTPEDIYNIFGENMLEKLGVELDDFTAFLDQMESDEYAHNYYTQLQDKSAAAKSQLDDYISNLSTRYDAWYTEFLGLDPYDKANEERIKQLQEAMASAEKILHYEDPVFKNIEDLFNSADYSAIVVQIEALAKEGKLTEETFNNVEGIERFKEALNNVGENGLTVEEVIESLNDKIQKESKNTADGIQNLSEAFEKLYDTIDDVLSKQEKLADAFKKTRLGAKLTIQELYELIKEMPSLAQYASKDGDGYTISTEGFEAVRKENDNAIKELIEKDLESVRNDIALLEKEKELQAEKDKLYQQWENTGGANKNLKNQYDEVAAEYEEVANQCQNIALSMEELTEAEKGFVIFNDLVGSSFNEAKLAIEGINEAYNNAKSKVSEYNSNIQTIDNAIKTLKDDSLLTYDEMNALVDLAPKLQDSFDEPENGLYSITIEALEELREESYKTRNDYIDDRIATVRADIEAAKETKKAYEDEIKKIASVGTGALAVHSAYIAALEGNAAEADEKLKVLYDTINKLEGLQGNITSDSGDGDLSDKLQNQIDQYKTILSAVDAVKNKYSEAIDKEIDALNDGKAALRDSNDERQRELDLIEARNNLENAKKRKVWVYSEGEGFKQVTDEGAVKEAEEDLRNVVVDIQEAEIDKRIEALEDQKEQLEENTKALTELESEIEDAKNIAQAVKALGLNDESELLTLPDDTVEEIRNGFAEATLQKDIEDNKNNEDYVIVSMDELLQSLGAKVNAAEAVQILGGNNQSVYDAAVQGFKDALNEQANNAVSSVVNNGGTNFTNTFNIYDATDPERVAKIVNQEITDLFTKIGNSIK